MFEAARHGGGGHWERVGRGGDWRGWQVAEDRGELGKTYSSTIAVIVCAAHPQSAPVGTQQWGTEPGCPLAHII